MVYKKIVYIILFLLLSALMIFHFIFSFSSRFEGEPERKQSDVVFDINNYINEDQVDTINNFLEKNNLIKDPDEEEIDN